MVKLFHEAESRPSSALHFPGRKLPNKTLLPPQTGWPGRERVKEDTPVVQRSWSFNTWQQTTPMEHLHSLRQDATLELSLSFRETSPEWHFLGEVQLLCLKLLFCQCFQSSSFSKGLTAFSYTNQTKKRQLHSPKCQWGKSRPMVTHLFRKLWKSIWEAKHNQELVQHAWKQWKGNDAKDLKAHEPKTASGIYVCTNVVLPNRSGHTCSLMTADVNWFQRNIFINCFIKNELISEQF